MPELLNIGSSGLRAVQQALSTTSNNIVNANTEGYSRQRVDLDGTPSQRYGDAFLGTGVTVTSVTRAYDEHLTAQVRELTSSQSAAASRSDMLSRLDSLLSNAETGLNERIQGYFNALQDLAANPAGTAERQVVLAEAQTLAARAQGFGESIASIEEEVEDRLANLTVEINDLTRSIADVNLRLNAGSSASSAPNDLLDQRDRLLAQLSERVDITVLPDINNTVTVQINQGLSLVSGSESSDISVSQHPYVARASVVSHVGSSFETPLADVVTGGTLGGLLAFRETALNPLKDQLGLVTTNLAQAVNDQHALGLDARGVAGGNFFTTPSATVLPHTDNGGTANLSVALDDVTALRATAYKVTFDGTDWHVDGEDGTTATGSLPMSLDGLTISVTGSAAAGDSFLVQPVRQALNNFDVALISESAIAAASPVAANVDVTNMGDPVITGLGNGSTTGLPLAADVVMTFDPDALGAGVPGFVVTGSTVTTIAYDPTTDQNGITVSLPAEGDLSFTLSGQPADGDVIRISNNSGFVGDNTNLLAMIDLQAQRRVGGEASFEDAYGSAVTRIGVESRHASVSAEADSALLRDASATLANVTGVNLEEEAANLLRLQQAYQANAQLISVADSLFQTLLGATRG